MENACPTSVKWLDIKQVQSTNSIKTKVQFYKGLFVFDSDQVNVQKPFLMTVTKLGFKHKLKYINKYFC